MDRTDERTAARADTDRPKEREGRPWLGLFATLIATFMGMLDVFIVNVAAPSIQQDLGASFAQLQLVIAGYVVAYAIGLVCGGRLGDRYGRRRMFLLGVTLFVLLSAACGFAPNPGLLIAARVGQGLGAALMLPQVLSNLQVVFEGDDRKRALGYYGATIGIGSICGQIVGGLLIDQNPFDLHWRSVFLVNVPIGIVCLLLARAGLAETRAPEPPTLDLVGAALLAVGLGTLLYGLTQGAASGWPGWVWPVFAVTALGFAGFVLYERRIAARGGSPLLPPRLFGQRGFAVGLPIAIVFYSGNAGLFLILAYFLQDGLAIGPLPSGFLFLPLGVGFALASLVSQRLVGRFGVRALAGGAAVMVAGLVGLLVVPFPAGVPAAHAAWLTIGLFVTGFGEGVIAPALISAVLGGVRPDDAGAASGALLTATQMANALGVAVLGTVFAALLTFRPGERRHEIPHYAHAFAGSQWVLIALGLATLALLLVLGRAERAADRPAS